jgi:hypothetical protein
MGRTIPSFRIALAMEEEERKPFRNALDKKDTNQFDEMFDIPKFYISACSNTVQLIALDQFLCPFSCCWKGCKNIGKLKYNIIGGSHMVFEIIILVLAGTLTAGSISAKGHKFDAICATFGFLGPIHCRFISSYNSGKCSFKPKTCKV